MKMYLNYHMYGVSMVCDILICGGQRTKGSRTTHPYEVEQSGLDTIGVAPEES